MLCRKDPCFRALESVLSDALPVLVHKPCFLVLAAHYCTLGLMIKRLKTAPPGKKKKKCFVLADGQPSVTFLSLLE